MTWGAAVMFSAGVVWEVRRMYWENQARVAARALDEASGE